MYGVILFMFDAFNKGFKNYILDDTHCIWVLIATAKMAANWRMAVSIVSRHCTTERLIPKISTPIKQYTEKAPVTSKVTHFFK